ncbi:MAG: hypothetical protein FJ304_21120 [Planctomycetes bacterium]|nr:hypothetical protein [Planctomycetota bacterium]
MKRLLLAAVAGLCAVGSARAQDGYLAPTAPVVPAPLLKNGSVLAPAGSWGPNGTRAFVPTSWSPLRNPVGASVGERAGAPAAYGYPVPPLPAGVGGADGLCGAGGCATPRASGSCLDKMKAWLCYHPSKTELPKLQPAPYVTPLQGMFPCASGSTGCAAPGCATPAHVAHVAHVAQKPALPAPPQSTVSMPPRGTQGTTAPAQPSVAAFRYATPTVVPAGAKVPQK